MAPDQKKHEQADKRVCLFCKYYRAPNEPKLSLGMGTYKGGLERLEWFEREMADIEQREVECVRDHGNLPWEPRTIAWCEFLSKDASEFDPDQGMRKVFVPCFIGNPKGKCGYFEPKA